jgi:hypothetical protein
LLWIIQLSWMAVAIANLCIPSIPQQSLEQMRSRFDRASDAVHKSKLMPRLGDAEFQEIQSNIAAGELTKALDVLEKYRDQARLCQKGLDATGADAEKSPSGFKELQISVRGSLRQLNDIILALSPDDQKPFEDVRKDLDQMNRHLIQELFPRNPGGGAESTNPKR